MGISAQILVYTAWLVVAIAMVGAIYLSLARRDFRRDRAVLSEQGGRVAHEVSTRMRLFRARSQPMTPGARTDFQVHKSVGIRVALFLMVPLLILGYRWAGREWGLVVVLCGLIYVPLFTLPFSIVHTYLLRLAGSRGPVVSTLTGLLMGLIAGRLLQDMGFEKLAIIYGGVYGLIIGLGNTSIAAPGLIADDRPRTLEEQARADGLQ